MSSHLKNPVNETDHIQGSSNASIEIVEYGDYQCSYCGEAYPIIKRIQAKFGDQIKFVFRNFPLTEIHPYAYDAALAAEAAGLQGKFWEMHDLLFEHQNALDKHGIMKLAERLDVDIQLFEEDMQSAVLQKRIDDSLESGMLSGVNGTPSFFINGGKFNGGAQDLSDLLDESVE
ncbi:DsbA family protein [Sphingobacterium hungaricum]|uniref:Disulfide bond formation protein DsbA n=1 Tax=Sphingobacterium hungaricum TaxID=2082723 RepID=A0A928V0D9_9SPHI|nr:DsbA family protein [Sphingobacterium hungaricum]MBE8714384.1 disulfide bond formation protein DsbA [Sphingobacterium hungaricum]